MNTKENKPLDVLSEFPPKQEGKTLQNGKICAFAVSFCRVHPILRGRQFRARITAISVGGNGADFDCSHRGRRGKLRAVPLGFVFCSDGGAGVYREGRAGEGADGGLMN